MIPDDWKCSCDEAGACPHLAPGHIVQVTEQEYHFCRGTSGSSRRGELFLLQAAINRTINPPPPGLPGAAYQQRLTVPCIHRGEQSGWRDCRTCKGNVRQREYPCWHPDHTTKPLTVLVECQACRDYEARPEPSAASSG